MDKVAQEIFITRDYDKLKILPGNRPINKAHVAKLKASMSEELLTNSTVSVNERMEVLDGQHRLQALRELNLPVRYIITKGYKLSQAQRMNNNSRTWKPTDFLKGYCDMGLADYLLFKKFQERYQMPHNQALTMLTGMEGDTRDNNRTFQSGKFKVKSYGDACRMADQLEAIGAYYPNYRRRSFVECMIQLFGEPKFDFDIFMKKLKIQPKALQDCVSIKDYRALIEDIYNYMNRNKINLRIK